LGKAEAGARSIGRCGALQCYARLLDFPNGQCWPIREMIKMSDELKCNYCFGTGQKVEMTPRKLGQKIPPYQPCPSCGGSGNAPKPVRVWRRRKSMRRVT